MGLHRPARSLLCNDGIGRRHSEAHGDRASRSGRCLARSMKGIGNRGQSHGGSRHMGKGIQMGCRRCYLDVAAPGRRRRRRRHSTVTRRRRKARRHAPNGTLIPVTAAMVGAAELLCPGWRWSSSGTRIVGAPCRRFFRVGPPLTADPKNTADGDRDAPPPRMRAGVGWGGGRGRL
uniref:Uncharacterized protein n=1 Tax=Oryza meridionalis TaxID=40149 RepID=A0A0E0E1Z1_9ORYZ